MKVGPTPSRRYFTPWPFEYAPLQGGRTIRLLYIKNTYQDDRNDSLVITGRLTPTTLDKARGKYVALSYTWGRDMYKDFEQSYSQPYEPAINAGRAGDDSQILGIHRMEVTCSYNTMILTPNISHYFRKHASTHIETSIPVWIDAICINQQDPVEVEHRLLLQGQICSPAIKTNVWLDSSPTGLT